MIIDLIRSAAKRVRNCFAKVAADDCGIGVVEVILILVVLIGLVVIFRDQLTSIINGIFGRIAEDAGAI